MVAKTKARRVGADDMTEDGGDSAVVNVVVADSMTVPKRVHKTHSKSVPVRAVPSATALYNVLLMSSFPPLVHALLVALSNYKDNTIRPYDLRTQTAYALSVLLGKDVDKTPVSWQLLGRTLSRLGLCQDRVYSSRKRLVLYYVDLLSARHLLSCFYTDSKYHPLCSTFRNVCRLYTSLESAPSVHGYGLSESTRAHYADVRARLTAELDYVCGGDTKGVSSHLA